MKQEARQRKERFDLAAKRRKNLDTDEEDEEDKDDEEKEVDEEDLEQKKIRKQKKIEKEMTKIRRAQKVGVVGHFLSPKPLVISEEGTHLVPEKGDDKPKKLFDLKVAKRGPFAANRGKESDLMKEDAFLQAEEERLGKAAKEAARLKKIEEAK